LAQQVVLPLGSNPWWVWKRIVRSWRLSYLYWIGTSDCNPTIEFSIPGSGIEKFV